MADIIQEIGRLREDGQGREFEAGRSVGRGRGTGLESRHVRDAGGSHDSRPAWDGRS